MIENNFYAYGYVDPRSADEYFYIGKGRGRAALRHFGKCKLQNRKNYNAPFYCKLRQMLNDRIRPRIVKIVEGLTEDEAFERVQILTRKHGHCLLSIAPPKKAKVKAKVNIRPICRFDISTGAILETFMTVREAASKCNYTYSCMRNILRGKQNSGSFRYLTTQEIKLYFERVERGNDY